MASSSISIDPIKPEEYVIDDNKTCSPFVLRKTYIEILPTEQIEFLSNSGQDTIKFTLASNSDFWLADESYMKFSFTNKTTGFPGAATDGVAAPTATPTSYPGINPYESSVALSTIGAHSLFRMMEIKAVASGTLLAQAQFYNHQFASMQLFENEQSAEMMTCGLGKNNFETKPVHGMQRWRALGANTTATLIYYPATASVPEQYFLSFTKSAANIYTNPLGVVNVGDIIFGSMDRVQVITATAIANGTVTYKDEFRFKVLGQGNYAIDTAANPVGAANNGYVYHVEVLSSNSTGGNYTPAANQAGDIIHSMTILNNGISVPFAKRVCDGNEHVIVMNLKNSFFWYNWPLFLLKGGIEIIFYLENGNIAMMHDPLFKTPATATVDLAYSIKFPRIVARMSTPEPSIQRDFVSKWNSDMGLIYYCPQIVSKRITGNPADGTMNLNLQFGKRSVRLLLFMIAPSSAYSTDNICRCTDSFRCYIQSHLRYYQLQIGAHLFPLRRMDQDSEGMESMLQSRMAAPFAYYGINGINTNIYERGWVRAQLECADAFYWNSITGRNISAANTEADVKAVKVPEVRERIYSVDFSRSTGKGGMLTGIDASMASIDLLLDRNGKVFTSQYDSTERPGQILWDNGIGAVATDNQVLDYVGVFPATVSPVYWAHAVHDHFIRLSAQGISVLN